MDERLGPWGAVFLGLFALASASASAGGLFLLGRQEGWFEPVHTLETTMASVPGLRIGTRIRVHGIPAGRVTEIVPPAGPAEPVLVRFQIEGRFCQLVRVDARCRLVKDGLFGARVLELEPGSPTAEPAEPGTRLHSEPTVSADDVLERVDRVVAELQAGNGTLGKLLTDESTYQSLNSLVEQAEGVLTSVDETYRSAKESWMVRPFVDDRYELLVRPDANTKRRTFTESDLFERGSAILSPAGKSRLADSAGWIHRFDGSNAEVLIAAFAEDTADRRLAQRTTQKQAEAVLEYLTSEHAAHKTGWVWRRTISAHGFGNLPNPLAGDAAPARRVEILIFER